MLRPAAGQINGCGADMTDDASREGASARPDRSNGPAGLRVVLFGGAGFIGRHAQAALLEGGARVVVCDRPGTEDGALPGASHRAIAFEDPDTYCDALDGADALVLLVSASVPGTYANDLAAEIEANVVPYARLVQGLRDRGERGSAVPHLVYLSSGGTVYGAAGSGAIREDAPLRAISPYGIGKMGIEGLIRAAPGTHTILRPSNPVGPGQDGRRGQGIVATVLDLAARGEPVPIWGDGLAVRDYFDVRDLADAIARAVALPAALGQTFNVGSGVGRTTLDVLGEIEAVLGRAVAREFRPTRAVDVPSNVLDIQLIGSTVGWRPRHSLRKSIGDMVSG